MASRNEIMEYRREKIKKFMYMEEEEDDELFLVILPALLQGLNEEKEPEHTSGYTGAIKMDEILAGHVNWCRSEFRMEPHIFKAISNYLRREGLLRDTRGVKVEEQLGIFMFMLSHNASIGRLKKTFQHSGETIHRHLKAIFNIIPTLTHRFLKLPSSMETHPRITSDSQFWPFFKNCIGAIDGTHVPITIAEEKAPPYRNRKGTLSQNVMIACDFNLNFTFISCGWEGSASDAGILRSAITKGFQVPEGKYYLVDGGYANTPSFLAPYRGVQYHLGEFRSRRSSRRVTYADYKDLFNHRHALLRNYIERGIGVLKKRFQILKVGTHHPIESQIRIPAIAAVFHNLIRNLNGDERWLDHQPVYIQPESFIEVPEGDDNYENDVDSLNVQVLHGSDLRDQIAMQMWNQYIQNRA